MRIAKPLQDLIEAFQKLPGIGPKTSQRLAFYLLHVPQTQLQEFAEALLNLKKKTFLCKICKNVSEKEICDICSDPRRNKKIIMVVEEPLDVVAFEKTGKFNGVYHVLHGSINPLENIGPEELFLDELFSRIDNELEELIIATNPTLEGEATAMYINKKIKEKKLEVKVSRLGLGIPTGADLEYADELTLIESLLGRRQI